MYLPIAPKFLELNLLSLNLKSIPFWLEGLSQCLLEAGASPSASRAHKCPGKRRLVAQMRNWRVAFSTSACLRVCSSLAAASSPQLWFSRALLHALRKPCRPTSRLAASSFGAAGLPSAGYTGRLNVRNPNRNLSVAPVDSRQTGLDTHEPLHAPGNFSSVFKWWGKNNRNVGRRGKCWVFRKVRLKQIWSKKRGWKTKRKTPETEESRRINDQIIPGLV